MTCAIETHRVEVDEDGFVYSHRSVVPKPMSYPVPTADDRDFAASYDFQAILATQPQKQEDGE